jgi:ABC-type phosphate transport system substrate-binding protein
MPRAGEIKYRPSTFNFTYYLSEVRPDWKSKVGTARSVEWPVGIGAKGNKGVANNVMQTQGSIGYVELAYALQNKMTGCCDTDLAHQVSIKTVWPAVR